MKYVKEGMYVSILRDTPEPRYFHARVTAVTDQDTVSVAYGVETLAATRLATAPKWRVNRFGAGA